MQTPPAAQNTPFPQYFDSLAPAAQSSQGRTLRRVRSSNAVKPEGHVTDYDRRGTTMASHFTIFLASEADASSDAPLTQQLTRTFNLPNSPTALLHVPHADLIRIPENDWAEAGYVYKQAPYLLTSLPTILKFTAGEVVGRIEGEEAILADDRMATFLRS